ncbi:hypothetical protein ATANTOWER_024813 [Ataeniobius toweri]|uniref:Uncharacterized protein n=1 Tax=Ataeniobius toweri TaxID=208326 RepID=A0ABU7CJD7_9TELE|nr:hypothetical protein [Ataeniobius toweri]
MQQKLSLVYRMAAALRPSPLAFIILLFVLSGGPPVSVSCFKVTEGGVASLSCQYSVKRFGLSRVCWGRGCGTFWCSNILVQTDENGVISKVSLIQASTSSDTKPKTDQLLAFLEIRPIYKHHLNAATCWAIRNYFI